MPGNERSRHLTRAANIWDTSARQLLSCRTLSDIPHWVNTNSRFNEIRLKAWPYVSVEANPIG